MTKPLDMRDPKNWPEGIGKAWPLGKIKPYPKNPRTHPDEQIALLASLMKKYGPDQPIVVDEKGVVLKGHGRLMAAKLADFEEFPVVQHTGLSEDDKRAIRIADNQVALMSDWNHALLKIEIGELKLSNFDMPLLGFDTITLKNIGLGLGEFASEESDANRGALLELVNITIDEPKHQVSSGDHYVLSDRHHLFCESVVAGWPVWSPHLKNDALFAPYPGVFVPFGSKAKKQPLVMVQSDTYIAGHILDRYAEVHGKKAIKKVSA